MKVLELFAGSRSIGRAAEKLRERERERERDFGVLCGLAEV